MKQYCAYKFDNICDVTEMEIADKKQLEEKIKEWIKVLDCEYLSNEAVYKDGYFYLKCKMGK